MSEQPTAIRKPCVPFNTEFYRLQVEKIFYTTDRNTWGSEARAAEPLLDIVDISDDYVQQMDFTDAATLYEIVIRGILDNYDSFCWHADEGQLDDVVEDCVDGLSNCLRGVKNDTAVRRQILQTLFDVYDFDTSLENDMPVMSAKVPAILVRYTTPEERRLIAEWVRETFDLDIDWHADEVSEDYDDIDVLLLGLEGDTVDDETFLRISHEMESYHYVVDRLLKLGRLDDALAEAKREERIELFTHANSRRCLPTRTICQAVSNSRRRERFGALMAGMAHCLSGNQAKNGAHPTIEEYVLVDSQSLKIESYYKG